MTFLDDQSSILQGSFNDQTFGDFIILSSDINSDLTQDVYIRP